MSLRLRLLLTTALIVLVALVVADVATYTALRSYVYTQTDTTLELSHAAVEASITGGSMGPPPSQQGPPQNQCPAFDGTQVNTGGLTPGTVLEVWNKSHKMVWDCTIAELGATKEHLPALPSHITGFHAYSTDPDDLTVYLSATSKTGNESFRVRVSVLHSGPDAGGDLVVALPMRAASGLLSDLEHLELVVSAVALLVALVVGWLLVRANLRPLREVEYTADAIAQGQLYERVRGDEARTEVGRVARALNYMLGRIQVAFAERDRTEAALRASEERMRRFVADASHELRTPLAAVRAYAELFDRGAADRPEDLRRLLDGIQLESGRMGHLVEDLLLLAHLDEGRPLELAPTDLVSVAGAAVTAANAVGPQWPTHLVAARPVEAFVDGLRVRQVLDNLLGNVRIHCPVGTTATVHVTEDGADAIITVSDDGPGMSDEHMARVFERFHRVDTSRSRHDGGNGLGLAIVHAIVHAHSGTVTVSRATQGGVEFTVRLPKHPSRVSTLTTVDETRV